MIDFTRERFWKSFWVALGKEVKNIAKREGFSYWGIPKEEQIRSALYAHIRKYGGYAEIESDFPPKNGKRPTGEADLRVLGGKEQLLIEIKRAFALKTWQNGYPEALGKFKTDIEKLNKMKKVYAKSKPTHKCFFLVVFFDSDKLFERVKRKEINDYIQKEWGNFLKIELATFKFGTNCCRGYVWVER